ncbi:hypothetical protein CTA1_2332 [Colletotrichum tanaceti]|uniref:Uncharacterized protein n=1 Tax=Colletotrichum tanaceti TaxID=1306861 RepID=A0A4U6XBC2_9PEZI|nr:hypothetical protein CTA1_2332 [Colletotrichum tanaceti]
MNTEPGRTWLKGQDDIAERRRVLEELLYDFEDFLDLESFDSSRFAEDSHNSGPGVSTIASIASFAAAINTSTSTASETRLPARTSAAVGKRQPGERQFLVISRRCPAAETDCDQELTRVIRWSDAAPEFVRRQARCLRHSILARVRILIRQSRCDKHDCLGNHQRQGKSVNHRPPMFSGRN